MLTPMLLASCLLGLVILCAYIDSRTSLLVAVGVAFLVGLYIRLYVAEPFVNTANNMAPTLLGEHVVGVCPECGAPLVGSPIDESSQFNRGPHGMICENFHISKIEDVDDEVLPADRVLVNKLLTPQRWDVVVFRFPQDPSALYMKRLIGLPGETITIEDGAIVVDGERLTPPEHLEGLEYWSYYDERQRPGEETWGHPDRPAVLGEGEYFVLGDFTARSNDSRHWQVGALGHPPYAVPESHLYGVVTHIYWPLSRWRVLR